MSRQKHDGKLRTITARAARRAGFVPVRYQLADDPWIEVEQKRPRGRRRPAPPVRARGVGFVFGWIYKRDATHVWIRCPSLGKLKLPASEEDYMAVTDGKGAELGRGA